MRRIVRGDPCGGANPSGRRRCVIRVCPTSTPSCVTPRSRRSLRSSRRSPAARARRSRRRKIAFGALGVVIAAAVAGAGVAHVRGAGSTGGRREDPHDRTADNRPTSSPRVPSRHRRARRSPSARRHRAWACCDTRAVRTSPGSRIAEHDPGAPRMHDREAEARHARLHVRTRRRRVLRSLRRRVEAARRELGDRSRPGPRIARCTS